MGVTGFALPLLAKRVSGNSRQLPKVDIDVFARRLTSSPHTRARKMQA